MGVDDKTTAAARPVPAALSAVFAGGGMLVMASVLAALWPAASRGEGEDALIAAVLVGIAGLGVVLCGYLALIWSLAALALLVGPASRTGTAVLLTLRVLAPQVARRVALGAAVATTATGLVLVPATAASSGTDPGGAATPPETPVSSQLVPTGPSDPDPRPVAEAPASSSDEGGASPQLPPLGWGEQPAVEGSTPPGTHDAQPSPADPPSSSAGDSATPTPPRTVVVHDGDTLWSITDELLGPAPDDPSEIALAWPELHEANHDLVGPDPDHLEPGQELTVPASLSPQEQ